jgi:hypothetical protein
MAKVEEYAQWIIDNADKKGTKEFNIVAQAYQEAKGIPVEPTAFEKELAGTKADTGFTGAFKAGKERLKGDVAALAGRTGIMDTEAAEKYKTEKERLAEKMFTPTKESFAEAPFTKFKELLGGSLPYTAAPLAVGIGAAALPAVGVAAPIATGVGLAGAGLASLAQFTGSNLSRQMQENPQMRLADTSLSSAAAAAAPQAALDVVSLRMIPGIGKIFGAAGKEITPKLAQQIAEQGILKTTGAYGAGALRTATIEGTTEAGQQFLERLQAGLNLTDQQARDEYFDSFIGGAVLGGTLGVPGTYLERGQIVRKGAEMEKEEQQKAIQDRQKAQQAAYLAEQAQLKQTSQNLGVPSTLALPAPETKLEPIEEQADPLKDPLGRFKSTDLSAKEVAEVNKRRLEMGKPRIGRTFSIEDLADVFKPEESTAAEGVLGRLIASRTNFTGEDIPVQTVELAAQQRGLDTRTQGFRDFLARVTGSEDLNTMSPPQRFAVAQAIRNLKAGEETQILEAGITNAKHYTPDQYNDTLKGLSKEFKEMGNQENGRSSVLKLIEKYSGLKQERDQQRILDEAVRNGDLERNVKASSTGNTIETFKPATAMTPLPGGMDIRKETFKQGETPSAYEVRAGNRVISTVETAQEAEKNAAIYEQNRQSEIVKIEKTIKRLESEMAKRDAELVNDQALGYDQGNPFFIKSANYYGQNQVTQQTIKNLREEQQTFSEPVRVAPLEMKPVAKDSFTFYEKDQPQVKFDSEEQAEAYGISRLDDKTLQQIIDSAGAQKQTGRVKRYADLAQKELNDRQSIETERGIAITTTKGLKGSKERLESLGIYSKEAHDNLEKLRQTLLPALKRFGLEKVALRVLNSIEDGTADGYYIKQVMAIALDSKNPMGTLRHESIHALKELGAFTAQEWKVLENKAKSEWVQKYIKDAKLYDAYKARYLEENGSLTGFEPYIQEEAIAEAFKHFKVGSLPPGMIGNIWVRLNKMFEALRNSFNKLGFQTTDDIFTSIEEGKKQPAKEAVSDETKLSIKPRGDYEVVRKAQPRGRTTDQVSYELRRISDGRLIQEFDKRKDAQQMLDVYTLPQEEVFAKYPELKPKYSLRKTSSLENILNFARDSDFKRNRDLKIAIQDQVLAAAEKEGIDLASTEDETTEYLVQAGVDDAIYALKSNANAVGWYDKTVSKALNIVSLMHPEIKTDPDAKFAFTWALAVTSNGINVETNFELAEQVYNTYKKTGEMPSNIKAGKAQETINKSLKLFNDMVKKYGMDDMRKFMATEFTVKQIESLTNLEVGGEFADTRVLGASILGPKIGNGFFSNLNGIFDQLTMDRWLMRTWGRWTGSLIQDNERLINNKRGEMERLIKAILKPAAEVGRKRFERIIEKSITNADLNDDASVDALATAINKASQKPINRTFFNKNALGRTMRKTSNSLVDYIDAQKETPAGPAERNYIREVFSEMLDKIRERGYPNMTMSDLQALLWYPEKRLYDISKESDVSEGYTDDEAPDYANAAAKLARLNGIPESKIKAVITDTEKDYANRTAAIQRNDGKRTNQVGSQGRDVGFAGKERSHFITRGIIRSYRERNAGSPNPYKGTSGRDGNGFRILGQNAVAEFKPVIKFKNALKNADVTAPTFYELDSNGAALFQDSIATAKASNRFGAAVQVYPEEDYADMRMFLTNDGKAGFALKGDDIVSVFSQSPHIGGVNAIMQLAVQEGGRRLDAYDTILPRLYYNNGFKTVARLKFNEEYAEGWDKKLFADFSNGKPDVVFMVYDPEYNQPPTKSDGVMIDEYDEGSAEQAKSLPAGAKASFRRFDESTERPSTVSGGVVLGTKQADSVSVEGIHYSNAEQSTLNGNQYGSGIKGAEAERLAQTNDPRIKNRIYFYIENAQTGRMQPKEAGLGNYVHKQKFDNILAPSKKMTELWQSSDKNYNMFESAVIDAGYDGYAVPDMGMMVILNHNTSINYEGTVQELAQKGIKYSIRAPETKEFKQWFGDSKVVDEDGNPMVVYHATKNNFFAFDPKKLTKNTKHPTAKLGFFAAVNPESTDEFITVPYGIGKGTYEAGANVMPLYASIKNPITIPSGKFVLQSMALQNMKKKDADQFISEFIQSLRDEGHDGILITADKTGRGFAGGKEFTSDNWVALDPNQFKSAFNEKPTESSDIRYSLREFDMSDLPESGNYTLKAGTKIFHGAHKARAEEIEKGGKTLLLPSKVKQKSGGGNLYEGNLIWFGDKDLATGHSKSAVDTSKARYDAEEGIFREAGKAFSTITDRDYKLLNIWNYRLTEAEADQLNDVLGLPTYKSVSAGDSPYSAAYRAHVNGKNVNRYQVPRSGEFSDGLAMTAKALGFDGVFDQTGMAFTADNGIRLGDEATPMQRFALRSQLSDRLNERIGSTTTRRKQAGFVERLMDAISPTAMTQLRQSLINKYESIEILSRLRGEKMGGDQLLAENSAIAAALQSDRAAGVAASSFKDGIPVFDKGYTYVSNMDGKVKGLIPILEPLMKYKDPYIFQTFQYYAGTRRGRRLDAEGREKTFTKEDIAYGKELEAQFPEFATVFDEYQKYNSGLVKYMMDTGVISPQEAKSWTENWDYIPFYRQLDGEKTAGPKVFSSIAGVAKPKKLKGSEAPLDDFMETIVRNARAAIEAGMKNEAARRVIRDVVDFDLGEKLPSYQSGSDVVTVKENGMTVYYRVADPLLVESLKGLNLPQLPFMDFLSAPANLLRNFVTKDPGFILANLGRDSMQAWITSGTDMKPLIDSFKQFGKVLSNHSPEAYALAKSGLTGYDFAGDVKSSAREVEKELRKRSGTRTVGEKSLLPITAFWDMLEKGSHASDMATRAEVYKRTLERTGSEAEAFYQAMEVLNFSRKGNSALIRIVSAMIPFFNARVQGLDVLYRTGFGKTAMENKEKIQKAFIFRSMVLLGTSVMYWAMVSDDEDYKKLSKEERDNYWIIPAIQVGDKPFRFPIPFELGVLFKVLPERALEYSFGTDTGKDLRESLLRNAMSTLSFNPIPQVALPLVENATNHSFFTGEPIIGRGVEDLAAFRQYGAGTSELAKKLGKELDYSPQKIDNLIRGYTGTMGTYAMMLIDSALTQEGDPVKATKRMEQLPVIKRFFAGDMGTVSAYYDLKEEVNTVVKTVNDLQRTGNSEDLKLYLEENKKLYALKNYVGTLDKTMKQLNQAGKMINASKTMTADEKREAIDKIHDAQLKLTARVKILRKDYE